MMTSKFNAEAILKARLEDLKGRVAGIDELLQQPLPADFADQAGDLENQDALGAIEDNARRDILAIMAALNRIKLGTYGTCAECGRPIPEKRLEAVPTALRCIACEEKR
jgi:DnaK suppressor protein